MTAQNEPIDPPATTDGPSPEAVIDTATDTTATDTRADNAEPSGGTAQQSAASFARQAFEKARDLTADGKERAGSALDEVARMMGSAADTVDEKLGADFGKYARQAAGGISGFSDRLKAKEIDDLFADVQGFVRKSPVMAIGVAAAMGFVVARLVKAGLDGDDDQTVDAISGAHDPADA